MKIKRWILSVFFLVAIGRSGWAADTVLLTDDFNDGSLDSAKWTIIKDTGSGFDESSAGSSLTESGGAMNISQAASNSGGAYKSCLLAVEDVGMIVLSRTTMVHYANSYVSMPESLLTESGSTLMSWGYFNYSAGGTTRYGFGGYNDTRVTGLWDSWFQETITYDPTTGQGTYSLNGGLRFPLAEQLCLSVPLMSFCAEVLMGGIRGIRSSLTPLLFSNRHWRKIR